MEEKLSIEHRMTTVEDRSKSNTKRIDELEKRADDTEKLVTSVAVMAEKQNKMGNDICEMKADLKKLTDIPRKRWDSVVEKVLLCVVAAIVAYMLKNIGF